MDMQSKRTSRPWRRLSCEVVLAAALLPSAVVRSEINVVPRPAKVVEKSGVFKLPVAKNLVDVVEFKRVASVPKEGYVLSVSAGGIKVAASDRAGVNCAPIR